MTIFKQNITHISITEEKYNTAITARRVPAKICLLKFGDLRFLYCSEEIDAECTWMDSACIFVASSTASTLFTKRCLSISFKPGDYEVNASVSSVSLWSGAGDSQLHEVQLLLLDTLLRAQNTCAGQINLSTTKNSVPSFF